MQSTDAFDPTDAQDTLTRLWAVLLEIETPSIDADFFELGGTSMTVVKMLVEVSNTFHVDVDVASFLSHPTIRTLLPLIGITP